jgi:hypothetical protein
VGEFELAEGRLVWVPFGALGEGFADSHCEVPKARTRAEERVITNSPTNVEAAFEILLEEIEADIDAVNNAGAKGFEARDYEKAKDALEQAAQH